VFISHDPTFLARIATRVVEIEDGKARDYLGDYEYYLWKRAQELESIKGSQDDVRDGTHRATPRQSKPTERQKGSHEPAANAKDRSPRVDRRDLSKSEARLQKQVERLESEIASLESRIKARDVELADPVLYQDFGRWHELHLEQEQWKREAERMTGRWTDLSQELEQVRQKLAGAR
jgi:ATP-binding cassette subfamily F protein 3